MKYMYAAFFATWLIHIVYLIILFSGIARLRAEAKELERQ